MRFMNESGLVNIYMFFISYLMAPDTSEDE